jgi:AcrR family transcriptional regulator
VSDAGTAGQAVLSLRRARLLQAMAEVAAERGFAHTSVEAVVDRAGVSQRSFYVEFTDLEACFLEILDRGADEVKEIVAAGFSGRDTWQEGIRWGLAYLLAFLDSEPQLARVWLVESMAASTRALERREARMAELLDFVTTSWPLPPSFTSTPLALRAAFTAVRGLVDTHLLRGHGRPLIKLLGPLLGIALSPFLDADHIDTQVKRGEQLAKDIIAGRVTLPAPTGTTRTVSQTLEVIPATLRNPNARRARECLHYVAHHPGCNNRQISASLHIVHASQTSNLLTRLHTLGLISRHSQGPGLPTHWTLSAQGHSIDRLLHAGSPGV